MKRWMRWTGIAALAVVAVLVATKVIVELLDRTDPVDVAALARATPTADATRMTADRLATGVWAYDATGSEYVDVLGGPLHTFPDEVAQIVTDTECGQTITVMLFEQRYDTLDVCRDDQGRLVFQRFETRHEFVGVSDTTVTEGCDPIPIWWPGMQDSPHETASTDCRATGDMAGDVTAVVTSEVLGRDQVVVDGHPMDAVRMELTSQVGTPDDPTHGTYTGEFWFAIDQPLILRRTLDAHVDAATPVGTVGFEESFDIVAKSTEPAGVQSGG